MDAAVRSSPCPEMGGRGAAPASRGHREKPPALRGSFDAVHGTRKEEKESESPSCSALTPARERRRGKSDEVDRRPRRPTGDENEGTSAGPDHEDRQGGYGGPPRHTPGIWGREEREEDEEEREAGGGSARLRARHRLITPHDGCRTRRMTAESRGRDTESRRFFVRNFCGTFRRGRAQIFVQFASSKALSSSGDQSRKSGSTGNRSLRRVYYRASLGSGKRNLHAAGPLAGRGLHPELVYCLPVPY